MAAWERADLATFADVLCTDATLQLVPAGVWVDGNAACLSLAAPSTDSVGAWRMTPTSANGQPATLT